MQKRMGCPNLDVSVVGKGVFSSGKWVAKCRAQGGREMAPDQVIRLCVHNHGLGFAECCNLRNSKILGNEKPSYESCRFCNGMYR